MGWAGREGVQSTLRSYRGQEVDNVKDVDEYMFARILEPYCP
jgi:hypothetical protein